MKQIIFLTLFLPLLSFTQSKKVLDHTAYNEWQRIDDRLISNNGEFVAFTKKPNGLGNSSLVLKEHGGSSTFKYERSFNPAFSNNSKFLTFKISPDLFATRDLKRQKMKEKDMPKDTLGIYEMNCTHRDQRQEFSGYSFRR